MFCITVHCIKIEQLTARSTSVKDFFRGGGLGELWEFGFLF